MERKRVPLGNYITEYSVRNRSGEDIPVYSVTNSQGFCTEYFDKEVASKDKTTYKIVPRGYFAYNPSRINVGSVDWQRCEGRVIVSPLYNVFSVSEKMEQQYLFYFLKSNVGRQMIKAKASGSVRDNLKMAGGKNFSKLKRHVVSNANTLLSECATIPDVKAKIPELKELTNDNYWNAKDILKFEETRKSLRDIMKFIPPKKVKIHYTDFEDEVVFREEGRKVDMGSSDFEDYRAKVNEYVEAHKNQPAINKLLHNEPITADDYKELERIFTEELGTVEDYQTNYQDTPFGLLIRKIAKMDRDAAYAAFSTFIAEERPNAEQIHFIEQVVDYVVENGYINNVLDLMKAPFDRPYKFSVIFTREEQIKFVQVINSIKSNALVA